MIISLEQKTSQGRIVSLRQIFDRFILTKENLGKFIDSSGACQKKCFEMFAKW